MGKPFRVMQGNVARVLLLFKQYGQNMVYTLVRIAQQSLAVANPAARADRAQGIGQLADHACHGDRRAWPAHGDHAAGRGLDAGR